MSKRPTKKEPPEEDAARSAEATSEEPQASEETAVAGSADAGAQVRARSRRALTAVVVLIAVFTAGVVAWPFLLPRIGITLPASLVPVAPEMEERVAALEARLADGDRLSRASHGEIARLAKALDVLEERIAHLGEGQAKIDRLDRELDALEAGIAGLGGLGARIEALEQRPAPGADGEDAGGRLGARLHALENALAEIAEETAEAADAGRQMADVAARVAGLSHRVEALEAAARAGGGTDTALLLALGQLGEALGRGGAYGHALAAVETLAGGDEALGAPLTALKAHAGRGIHTLEALRAGFAAVAGDIVRAEAGEAQEGWWGAALARLAELVMIRRTGEIEGETAEARAARAEASLAAGDLAAAVAELSGLEGAPAEAAAAWLAEARARLAVEDALAALNEWVIARLVRAEALDR